MKKSELLIWGMLAAFSFLSTNPLINRNIWFFVAVSTVIGWRIIVKTSKQLQLQKAHSKS